MVSDNRALVPIIGFFEKEGLEPRLIEDGLDRLATWYSGRRYQEERFWQKSWQDRIEHGGIFCGSKRLDNW